MKKVVVVGAYPKPIGGVSSFCWRLANKDKGSCILTLIDPYFNNEKKEAVQGIDYQKTPFSSFLRFFWLFWVLLKYRGRKIHFNFSTPNALLFCFFLPKRDNLWLLSLHHGGLENFNCLKRVSKIVLKKFDFVFFFSESQRKFFEKKCDKKATMIQTNSYIYHLDRGGDRGVIKKARRVFLNRKIRAIASGYPVKAYNHLLLLDYFKNHTDKGLCLFLYGPDKEGLMKKLMSYNVFPNIEIFYEEDSSTFNDVLLMANFYLRPNEVDSFGIVVADAVNSGLTVIASNACERYPGAVVCSDISNFSILMNDFFEKEANSKIPQLEKIVDSYESYSRIYKKGRVD